MPDDADHPAGLARQPDGPGSSRPLFIQFCEALAGDGDRAMMGIWGWPLRSRPHITATLLWPNSNERFKNEQNNSGVCLIPRAESTPLQRTDGTVARRVERDADGNVIQLLLNDLQLSARDLEELETLVHLHSLVLNHANFADKDLPRSSRCASLEHVNLSGTDVTDAAIDWILDLKSLRSLCLGNVNISADAIARLKNGFQSRGQVVRFGYSRRTGCSLQRQKH